MKNYCKPSSTLLLTALLIGCSGSKTDTASNPNSATSTATATTTTATVANPIVDKSVFINGYDGSDQQLEGSRGSIEFHEYIDPDNQGEQADWLSESTGRLLTVIDDASFTSALQLAQPGDQIQLESGSYKMQNVFISGSQGNPITIESAPGQWAIFDGSLTGSTPGIKVRGSWLIFRNLEIKNGTSSSISTTQSHHNLYEGLKIHNNSRGFDLTDGSHHHMIRFNESYHNFEKESHGQNGDGFGVWSEGSLAPIGKGVILEHNIAWANSDDGFDMWKNQTTVTLRNNISRNNGYNVLSDPNHIGNGNAYKLGPEGEKGNGKQGHYVIGNIADKNQANGFDYNGGTAKHYIKGNVSTHNSILDYDTPNCSVFEGNSDTDGVLAQCPPPQ